MIILGLYYVSNLYFFFSFSKRFEEVTSTVRNANCESIVEAITDAMALSNGVPLILEACRTASVLTCTDGPHHLQLWAHDIDAIFVDIIFRRCSNKQSLLCNKEILEVDQHVWDILGFLVAYLPRQFRPKATGEFCRLDDLISFAWYTFLNIFLCYWFLPFGGGYSPCTFAQVPRRFLMEANTCTIYHFVLD